MAQKASTGDVERWLDAHLSRLPDDAHAWLALAESKERQGRLEDALDDLELAVHHGPRLVAVRLAHARVLADLGRLDEAEETLREALSADAGQPDVHFKLGNLLSRAGRYEHAVEALRAGMLLQPDRADIESNLSHALFEVGQIDEAIAAAQRAIAISPKLAEAHHNHALALLAAGRPDEALLSIERALAISDTAGSRALAGHVLRDLGRIDDAIATYGLALARDPALGDAIINRCYAKLLDGRYDEGWREYASRFDATNTACRGFPYPEWRGESLAGRTVLIYAEQGIGDEIMFASCIPDVLALAGRCVIECSARLASLYARSFPSAFVHGGTKADAHDWLSAAGKIDYQVARTVGASWIDGTMKTRGNLRSIPVDVFMSRMAREGIRLVSLQYAMTASERSAAGDACWPAIWDDFEDVAALMSELDAVVTIDNTVAHLAGALGCPGIVILHASPEWRYLQSGDRMPWYPSLDLIRRQYGQPWEETLATTVARLERLLAGVDQRS